MIGAAQPVKVREMLGTMMHERFYQAGAYDSETPGWSVGWACPQGSFSDCLPIWNEKKDVVLFITGEALMDDGDLDLLKRKGHALDPGNASAVVHLYEEAGLEFISRLNGWFSGVLADLRNNTIVLFNDRYGLNRVYAHETSDTLYFASEAKSLLKVLPQTRSLDSEGFCEYVVCGCALGNRTLFSGVSLLPPASTWIWSPGRPVRKEVYFRPQSWEDQSPLAGPEYYEQVKSAFARLLPKYLRRSKRMGMSLTGGLDGRLIMAWANPPPGSLSCYTFASTYRNSMDVTVARHVAQACGQQHQAITVTGEFLAAFPKMAEQALYISDGAMDVTGSVELHVNRIARQIAPIRLTGNYGSEILRRVIAFKPRVLNPELFSPEFIQRAKTATATYWSERQGHPLSFIAFKQVPWHHYSRLSVEQSQLTLRSPYLDNELVALAYQAPPDMAASNEPWLRLIDDGNPALSRIPTDRGLRARPVPVLGRARNLCQEFTFRAEYAYDYGMPQWLARVDHFFAPLHLERLFLGRHKFAHFRVWYRDQLCAYVREVLLDPRARLRPYLNGKRIEQIVRSHTSGERNYTSELHQLLSCELIQRLLIEQPWGDLQ